MIEGLFVITTIFVSYVVYQIVNEPKTTNTPETPQVQPEHKAVVETPAEPEKPATASVSTPKAKPATKIETKVEAKPEVAPVAVAVVQEAPAKVADVEDQGADSAEQSTAKAGLKNPKTGEVVLVYSNYRFAKRWVKEALVSEGLLGKIYKNNELNADVEAKIKTALTKLEAIDKYRP